MRFTKHAARFGALALATAVTAVGLSACSSPTPTTPGKDGQDLTPLTISVGRQPQAAGNSPITQYMIEKKLVEEDAKKYGYDLTVDWRDYPNAPPQVEAMVANRLDIGMWGNTPVVRSLAQKQPISVIAVGEGHLRFLLLTHKDSGITNVEDLKGKKVGVTIGADPHLAFLQMLQGELGTSDVDALKISLVNMPSQAASAQVPEGVDATVAIYPAYLAEAARNDTVVPIINSFGTTESGYKGSLGSGAGIAIPSAKDSRFAPEGFYAHRSFWVARDAVIKDNPGVITAFTEALQESITALSKMSDEQIAQLVTKYWGDPAIGAKVVADELLFQRGWAWATNGDGQVIVKLSQSLADAGVIKSPLTWDEAMAGFKLAGDAVKKGYEAAGSVPSTADFMVTDKADARGAPQWQLDTWKAPAS